MLRVQLRGYLTYLQWFDGGFDYQMGGKICGTRT